MRVTHDAGFALGPMIRNAAAATGPSPRPRPRKAVRKPCSFAGSTASGARASATATAMW